MNLTRDLIYRTINFQLRQIVRFGNFQDYADLELIRSGLYDGKTIQVDIEPGDATRYSLVLAPVEKGGLKTQHGIYIVRCVGSEPTAVTVLWDWNDGASEHSIIRAAATLDTANNEVTRKVLAWWLAHLTHFFDDKP